MRSALLVNPNSGAGLEPSLRTAFEAALAPSGGLLMVTGSASEAARFVASAPEQGFERIIVSGGDDSVRDLLPALLESGCDLGIVPRGTFNNLALALDLPVEPLEALKVALLGRPRPLDLGRVAGLYFTESAGVGYLAEAWSRAPQPEPTGFRRWVGGFLAASSALLDYRPLTLSVETDGAPAETVVTWDLTLANSRLFANNIAIAPGATLEDGLLDLTIWPPATPLEFLASLPNIMGETIHQVPGLRSRQVRSVRVVSAVEIPLRADNTVSRGTDFTFEVLPRALRVVRPS